MQVQHITNLPKMSMPQTVRVCHEETQRTQEKELGLPPLNISVLGKQKKKKWPGNYVLRGVNKEIKKSSVDAA